MPEAHAILCFLGAFLGCWGLSLFVRGFTSGGRRRGFDAAAQKGGWWRRRSGLTIAGICACGVAAGSMYAGWAVYEWSHNDPNYTPVFTLWGSVALAFLAFSLALLGWAIVGERSHGRRRCPRCWYDMSGAVGLRCPECGRVARSDRHLYRPRRRWRWAAAALVPLLLAGAAEEWPRYQEGGVTGLVPTTVLIAGMRWMPDQFILADPAAPEDRSLLSRFQESDGLWEWQRTWAHRRAAAIISRTQRLATAKRAACFLEDQQPQLLRPVALLVARTMCEGTAQEKSDAAELLFSFLMQQSAELNAPPLDDPFVTLGPALRPWSSGLRTGIEDPDRSIASTCALLLAVDPLQTESAAQALLERSKREAGRDRLMLAVDLRGIEQRSHGAAAREQLEALLKDAEPAARCFALTALGTRAETEPDLRETFRTMLNDPALPVACFAARALKRAATPADVRAILQQVRLRSGNPTEGAPGFGSADVGCDQLIWTLSGHSPAVQALLPEIAALLLDGGRNVRYAAAACIDEAASGGADISLAVPALAAMSQSADDDEREIATRAIRSWRNWLRSEPSDRDW